MAARDEAGRAWTGVPQGQSADEKSADEKMGPALPASHGPRTWDGGQVPCEGRPDTRWSGQAPSREQRGRSRFRPADCVRTEEITLDTVNLIQGGSIDDSQVATGLPSRIKDVAEASGRDGRNSERRVLPGVHPERCTGLALALPALPAAG